jgi:hypothetical protein
VRRLRLGEWLAGIGAVALFVLLFASWFHPDGASGWSALGWVTLAFAVALCAAGAWLFVATAIGRPLAQQVAACVLTATIGTFAVPVLVLRVVVFQPGPNDVTTISAGGWLGLVAGLLVAIAGWWAIKDERTGAPENAYTPPAPRPAPPERAA